MGQFENMTGKTFGRLTVEQRGPDDKPEGERRTKVRWWCRCACGGQVLVRRGDLVSGNTKSCGCWKRESQAQHRRNGSQRSDGGVHADQVRRAARARYKAEELLIDEHVEEFDVYYARFGALEDPPITPRPRGRQKRERLETELAALQARLAELEENDGQA
jgi:hypothetical protein